MKADSILTRSQTRSKFLAGDSSPSVSKTIHLSLIFFRAAPFSAKRDVTTRTKGDPPDGPSGTQGGLRAERRPAILCTHIGRDGRHEGPQTFLWAASGSRSGSLDDSSLQKSCVGVREVCLGAASTALLFRVVPTTFQCSRLRVVLLCQRSFDVEWIVAGVGKIPLTACGEMVKALFSRGSISNTAGDAG